MEVVIDGVKYVPENPTIDKNNKIMNWEEWTMLSAETRHRINTQYKKIEQFIRDVYGEYNEKMADDVLKELGII